MPASSVYYYLLHNPHRDWIQMWGKVPALGKRLIAAHLRYEEHYKMLEGGESVLESVVFELPGVKMCETNAFIGLVFVDGCFLNDRLRSTLLAVDTITADHIIVPLFAMICPGEKKRFYKRLFTFARESLPKRFTIMSDQGRGVMNAYKDIFGGSLDVVHVPCMFHVCQKFSKEINWEIKQLLTCDHDDAYKVMRQVFAAEHRRIFGQIGPRLDRMSYKSNTYAGMFEIMADSPIESLNAATGPDRSKEPLQLMEALLEFTKHQVCVQLKRLDRASTYCLACSNIIEHRRKRAKDLECRKENGIYLVSESFVTGTEVEYTVQCLGGILTCSCSGYERLGIPCRHLYAVAKTFSQETALPQIKDVHIVHTIRQAMELCQIEVNLLHLEEASVKLGERHKHPGRPRKQNWAYKAIP